MSTTVTRPSAAETALAYVREVRNRFERQPRTYEEFLNVMKDFKSGVCVPREPTRRDARNERMEWNATSTRTNERTRD